MKNVTGWSSESIFHPAARPRPFELETLERHRSRIPPRPRARSAASTRNWSFPALIFLLGLLVKVLMVV